MVSTSTNLRKTPRNLREQRADRTLTSSSRNVLQPARGKIYFRAFLIYKAAVSDEGLVSDSGKVRVALDTSVEPLTTLKRGFLEPLRRLKHSKRFQEVPRFSSHPHVYPRLPRELEASPWTKA
eukprot:9297592-Heterocapsa_arctica.AAC.1